MLKFNCISAEKIKKIVKNILHIQVPDEKHLRIDYTYEFKTNSSTPGNPKIGEKPEDGTKVTFTNNASVKTSDSTEESSAGENSYELLDSSGIVSATEAPSIVKVNIGDQTITLWIQTFKLAQYVNGKWQYANAFTPLAEQPTVDRITLGDFEGDDGTVPASAAEP